MASLTDSVTQLPGVGSRTATLLKKLGIETIIDLIYYFPHHYEDFSSVKKISELIPEAPSSIEVAIWQVNTIKTHSGKFLTLATLADSSGTIQATWFNQPFQEQTLKRFNNLLVSGKPTLYQGRLTFINPSYEGDYQKLDHLHTARLVPVYPQTAGLNSKWLRNKIMFVLKQFETEFNDDLTANLREELSVIPLKQALQQIHFPEGFKEVNEARGRLAFDELLFWQLASLNRKAKAEGSKLSVKLKIEASHLKNLRLELPFTLTQSQEIAIGEIAQDLAKTSPMNRLLQGDVGSGKTIVATAAAFLCAANGLKTLFMAPTEILAYQHYETVSKFFAKLPLSIGLQTRTRRINPDAQLLIGTHALLNLNVPKDQVGLIVIDEQHRFGVEQRQQLREKGQNPHLLTLSATPIPRSLALVFFGELDISTLVELPSGRHLPKTYLVPRTKRRQAYKFIEGHVRAGEQSFVICPFIEPSETAEAVKSAKQEFEILKKVFPKLKLGLLHGKLKSGEKELTLTNFRNQGFDILVATPIVEVGIDVPGATIILIEAAERFGLASLHQLRGRVARSAKANFCLLFTESEDPKAIERLKNMERLKNGFELAEADLKYRGPGQVFGTLQHGIPDLKIASFSDSHLIAKARLVAARLVSNNSLKARTILTTSPYKQRLSVLHLD